MEIKKNNIMIPVVTILLIDMVSTITSTIWCKRNDYQKFTFWSSSTILTDILYEKYYNKIK